MIYVIQPKAYIQDKIKNNFLFFKLMNGSFSLIISFVHVQSIYRG